MQKTVNRLYNRIQALAVQRRLTEQVKQRVGQRVRHQVKMSLTQRQTIQTTAYVDNIQRTLLRP